MKSVGFFLWIVLFAHCAFAQDPFDKLMTLRQLDCEDVSLNSSVLYKKYLMESKIDSAQRLLKYWLSKCGDREPVFRASILLSLIERNFNDTLLKPNTIAHLKNYISRMELQKNYDIATYEYYKSYYGYLTIGNEFDRFTQTLAGAIKETYPESTVEYLLAEFYESNGKGFFSKLQSDQYQGMVLQNRYFSEVDEYLNYQEMHMSWLTGIWIPTGDIEVLGNHPDMGFQIGYKKNKMSFDMTLTFKWGDTPTPYWARRTKSNNSRELTREFFGGYFGFDVGRDLVVSKRHELQALFGLGFDGFDVFADNGSMPAESVASYNLNFGLGYRYYLSSSFYMGLRAKYNVVDYTLNNVIDFTGNPITIHFAVGGLYNLAKKNNLDRLEYKGR
jgi:hypothetical protein